MQVFVLFGIVSKTVTTALVHTQYVLRFNLICISITLFTWYCRICLPNKIHTST
jgi:hypothetical protein